MRQEELLAYIDSQEEARLRVRYLIGFLVAYVRLFLLCYDMH